MNFGILEPSLATGAPSVSRECHASHDRRNQYSIKDLANFFFISQQLYYFPEIARAIYQTFGHSCLSCWTKENKFVPDWTFKYSRSEYFTFEIDQVTYWALIDYDFDQAIISPRDCLDGREILVERSQGINSNVRK